VSGGVDSCGWHAVGGGQDQKKFAADITTNLLSFSLGPNNADVINSDWMDMHSSRLLHNWASSQ